VIVANNIWVLAALQEGNLVLNLVNIVPRILKVNHLHCNSILGVLNEPDKTNKPTNERESQRPTKYSKRGKAISRRLKEKKKKKKKRKENHDVTATKTNSFSFRKAGVCPSKTLLAITPPKLMIRNPTRADHGCFLATNSCSSK
jgi:hypothetical protein